MKSRSFAAALFAAFAFTSFAPSVWAGTQDPSASQCRNVKENWSIYQAVGNEHLFSRADRKLLEKCRAIDAAQRRNQEKQYPASIQKTWVDLIFR